MWMDPITEFVLRLGRFIDRCEQALMRWLFAAGDVLVGLLLMATDFVGWLGSKVFRGYCEPDCPTNRLIRVDGMGDDPNETMWQCRECGRLHFWNWDEAPYDGP